MKLKNTRQLDTRFSEFHVATKDSAWANHPTKSWIREKLKRIGPWLGEYIQRNYEWSKLYKVCNYWNIVIHLKQHLSPKVPRSFLGSKITQNCQQKFLAIFIVYPSIVSCTRLVWECLEEISKSLTLLITRYKCLKWRKQIFLFLA